MRLCDEEFCTGCSACANACPVGAITFVPDTEGFLRPDISNERCVECGKCVRSCPQLIPPDIPLERKQVFACWHKDKIIRHDSTSGGVFTALAEEILEHGGKVYGAAFDKFPHVAHVKVERIADLNRLQGSKYVQSEIGHVFSEIKQDISNGIKVLFSGTPCQVAGLYAYLGSRYEKSLMTVDLVCHGVPSPKVFADYVKWVEQKRGASITEYRFRDKKIGWYLHSAVIKFGNGKVVAENFFKNPFSRGFLRNLFLRPSCHNCAYAGIKRYADITLSDFWGYKANRSDGQDKEDDKGVSMVMINTSAGAILFNSIQKHLVVWERGLDEAMRGNPALRAPFPASPLREQFWTDYAHLPFDILIKKYMYPEPLTDWWLERYTIHGKLRLLSRRIFRRCKRVLKAIFGEHLSSRVEALFGGRSK